MNTIKPVKPAKTPKAKEAANKAMKAKVLSVGLTAATIFSPLALGGCPTEVEYIEKIVEKEDTVQDFVIAQYGGKNIVLNCLTSQKLLERKISPHITDILSYNDATANNFKSYVAQKGMRIIIEDVEAYQSGKDYRITDSDNSFAMRLDFVLNASAPELYGAIGDAVVDMNNKYHVVSLGKQFNNARGTIHLAHAPLDIKAFVRWISQKVI